MDSIPRRGDRDLVPVIFQDHETDEVLVLGHPNPDALQFALDLGRRQLSGRSLPLCHAPILGESRCCIERACTTGSRVAGRALPVRPQARSAPPGQLPLGAAVWPITQ